MVSKFVIISFAVIFSIQIIFAQTVPTITSIAPASGAVGTEVIITGTNFSTVIANNLVWFEQVLGVVTSATATELKVKVPSGAITSQLTVVSNKLAVSSNQFFIVTYANGGVLDSLMFSQSGNFTNSTMPISSLISVDINNDGKTDNVIFGMNYGSVKYLKNVSKNNTIYFEAAKEIIYQSSSIGKLGDLNNDGKQDVILYNGGKIIIYKNISTQSEVKFEEGQNIELYSSTIYMNNNLDIMVEDLNNDGKKEIICVYDKYQTTLEYYVVVLKNNSTSSISISTSPTEIFRSSNNLRNIQCVDINNDGKRDIVLNQENKGIIFFQNNVTSGNITSASFPVKLTLVGSNIKEISNSDLNNDGSSDLILYTNTWEKKEIKIYKNKNIQGDIGINMLDSISINTGEINDYTYGKLTNDDFNGDGKIDIALLSQKNLFLFENSSTSTTFSFKNPIKKYTTYQNSNFINKADFNNDGLIDLIVPGKDATDFVILKHLSPTPTFSAVNTEVNFSGTKINNTYTYNLKIVNDSYTSSLEISSATVGSTDFQISPSSKTLAKGDTATFVITFKPTISKSYKDSIKFITNDPKNGTTYILLNSDYNSPISKITPAFESYKSLKNTNIDVEFLTTMNSATLTDQNIIVYGSLTGYKSGILIYNSADKKITFNPDKDFLVGEKITVTLKEDISTTSGEKLIGGYSWGFTVGATQGSGNFAIGKKIPFNQTDYYYNTNYKFADLDNDNDLDFVIINSSTIKVYLNRNNEFELFKSISSMSSPTSSSMSIIDIDKNGFLDIIFTASSGAMTTSLLIYKNDLNLSFTEEKKSFTESSPIFLLSDLNNDGLIDLNLRSMGLNPTIFYKNIGNNNFQFVDSARVVENWSESIYQFDFNNDGKIDFFNTGDYMMSKPSYWFKNQGNFKFTKQNDIIKLTNKRFNSGRDVNGDGLIDLIYTNTNNSNQYYFYKNLGNLLFEEISSITLQGSIISFSDFDGDKDLDLLSSTASSKIYLYENNGLGEFSELSQTTLPQSTSLSDESIDLDSDGDLDLYGFNSTDKSLHFIINRNNTPEYFSNAKSLDYGIQKINTKSVLEFKVYNRGVRDNLTLSNLKFNSNAFTYEASSTNILPSDSTTIKITFEPKNLKFYLDTLSITTNDPNKLTIKIALSGETNPLTSITPGFNALGIKPDVDLKIDFAFAVSQTDLDKKIMLSGSNSGLIKSNYTVAGTMVTINPDKNFKGGEEVTVTINGVKGSSGDSLLRALSYKFTVATKLSQLKFSDVQTIVPNVTGDKRFNCFIDIDSDGDDDLISYRRYSERFEVYKNNNSNYKYHNDITLNNTMGTQDNFYLSKADLNNDGYLDLVVAMADYTTSIIYHFENNYQSNLTLKSEVKINGTINSMEIADFDNDGFKEVIVQKTLMSGMQSVASIMAIKNSNKILKDTLTIINFNEHNKAKICVGDLDNDGDLDLAFQRQDKPIIGIIKNNNLLNKNYEYLEISTEQLMGQPEISASDFNNDGLLDLVLATGDWSSMKLVVYENNKNLNFTKKTTLKNKFYNSYAVADFNGDEKQDILYLSGDQMTNSFDIYLSKNVDGFAFNEEKIFSHQESGGTGQNNFTSLLVSDIDLDADLDVFISTRDKFKVLSNRNSEASLKLSNNVKELGVLKVDTTITWTEVVKNLGTVENLVISDIKSSNTELTITPTTANIAQSDSAIFTFTFKPKQTKMYLDTITFTSNDLNKLKTFLQVRSAAVYASSIVGGIIKTNTTWSKDKSPFVIIGSLTINDEATLTVNAGVKIFMFDTSTSTFPNPTPIAGQGSYINVKGFIKVNGLPTDRVIFDNLVSGKKWNGINFDQNNNVLKSKFNYLDLTNCQTGIYSSSWSQSDSSRFIVGAKFINSISGIRINSCSIDSSYFENCNTAIEASGELKIKNSYFNNNNICINLNGSSTSQIVGNVFKNSKIAIKFGDMVNEWNKPNLFGNQFEFNEIGLLISSVSPKANGNTFANNIIGIEFIKSWMTSKDTVRSITFNNIFNNQLYNVKNSSDKSRYIINNYWGSTDTLEIMKQIYDSNDNDSLGTVYYKPFLTDLGSTPSTPPKLIKPDSNSINVALPLKFEWEKMLAIEKYNIEVSTNQNFTNVVQNTEPINNNIEFGNLISNTKYYWRVRLYNPYGYGQFSQPWSFYTVVLAPTNLKSTVENKKIHLSWTQSQSQNILRYRIYKDTISDVKTLIDSVLGSVSTYSDSGLINAKKYYYAVQSINQVGIAGPLSLVHQSSPKNAPPKPIALQDNVNYSAGRQLKYNVTFNSAGSVDTDGKIDSTLWFLEGKLISTNPILVHEFPQGTSNLKLVLVDNEGARDSSSAKVIRSVFKQTFNGKILAGVTSIGETTFYVIAENDAVYKLDYYGVKNYNITVNGNIKSSSSVSFDTVMYIGSSDKNLYAFDNKGNNKWVEALGGELWVTPTIDSSLNRIYVGVSNNNFKAVNRTTGKVIWSLFTDAPISSSAVITRDRKLIFTSEIGTVYGVNISTSNSPAKEDWKLSLNQTITSSPAIDLDGNFYVGTSTGNIIKVSMRSNENAVKLWEYQTGGAIYGSPVIDGYGNLFVGSMDGYLYTINPSNGSLRWKFNSGAPIKSSPTLSSTRVYFASTNGKVWGRDTNNVEVFYYVDPNIISASLLHHKGTLFVGTEGKDVLAFYDGVDVGNLLANGMENENNVLVRNNKMKKDDTFSNAVKYPVWGTFQGNNQRTGDARGSSPVPVRDYSKDIPMNYYLTQNYPNPFNPSTTIRFGLPNESLVKLEIYNSLGQLVQTLVNEVMSAHYYEVKWEAGKNPTGLYFYKIIATDINNPNNKLIQTKKMMLVK